MGNIVTQVLKIHTVRSIGLFLFMTFISAFHATASQNNFCQDKSDELSCGNLGQFQNAGGLNSLDVLFQTGGVMKQHLSLKNSSDQYKDSDVNYGISEVVPMPKQKLISQQVINKILFALDRSGSQHLIRCSALIDPEVHSYLKNAIYQSETLEQKFLTNSNSANVSFSKTECKKFLDLVLR